MEHKIKSTTLLRNLDIKLTQTIRKSNMRIEFRIITYKSDEYFKSIELRDLLLRKDLGLKFMPEEFDGEESQIHIAGFKENELVSTLILVPSGEKCKMRQVCVRTDLQGYGIGNDMLRYAEQVAKNNGFTQIYCHARDVAVPFYLKNDYIAEGDYFEEVTIMHLKMRKDLIPILELISTSSSRAI